MYLPFAEEIMIRRYKFFVPARALVLALVLALLGPGLGAAGEMKGMSGISVADPWVRHAPPVVRTHAGYMTIHNRGETARAVVGAKSRHYKRVEIHVSRMQGGIATMERLAQVEVPAGGTARFQPGGLHFMLVGPKGNLALKDKVGLTLVLGDGAEIEVQAVVRKAAPGKGSMPHSQHGS